MGHVRELQRRLFVVVLFFLLGGAIAYPFFDQIVNVIVAPLGPDHQLVYLTPAGAFSFIIQVCMYAGVIIALPVIIYEIYRFVMPAVRRVTFRRAVGFTTAAFLLAAVGIVFSYYVILPAAIHFLTSFGLYHINPMLTIDSYFSFVMAYLIAGALLFQLPLLMLMVDSIKPTPPRQLMRHQDKMIVISFIVAAVISPTPDALNQTLLASPVVVMYQVGIILVWLRHRKQRRQHERRAFAHDVPEIIESQLSTPAYITTMPRSSSITPVATHMLDGVRHQAHSQASARQSSSPRLQPLKARQPVRRIDGFSVRPKPMSS